MKKSKHFLIYSHLFIFVIIVFFNYSESLDLSTTSSSLSERSSIEVSPSDEGKRGTTPDYINSMIKASMSLLSVQSQFKDSHSGFVFLCDLFFWSVSNSIILVFVLGEPGSRGPRHSLSAPSNVNVEGVIMSLSENIRNPMLFIEKQLNIYQNIFSKVFYSL